MTHDELLELTKSPTYMNSRTLEHPYIALRAVIELHRPVAQDHREYEKCWNCNTLYPCNTISSIEAALT